MMQTFYSLPPTTQRTFNPLSNPELLATLLVPQLEAYLASNTSTRFLMLHYPTDSLATVFALRKLLGGEMFKIAGILDSLASDPPSFVFRPRTTFNSPFSNEYPKHPRADSLQVTKQKASFANTAVTKMPSINLKQQDNPISFARADYLLPSTATDNEITTFLSGIWKTLMEKSSFYTPEPDPEPTVVKSVQAPPIPPIPRTPSRPGTPVRSRSRTRSIVTINKTHISNSATTNTGAAIRDRDRDSTYPPSRSPTLIQGAQSNNSCLHNKTGYAHSYAASIVSIRTAHTIQSERDGGRGRGGGGDKGGWENFYIGDEDSDDDEFDRMILGRLHAKIVPEVRMVDAGKWEQPERNKRKALKWLGLA